MMTTDFYAQTSLKDCLDCTSKVFEKRSTGDMPNLFNAIKKAMLDSEVIGNLTDWQSSVSVRDHESDTSEGWRFSVKSRCYPRIEVSVEPEFPNSFPGQGKRHPASSVTSGLMFNLRKKIGEYRTLDQVESVHENMVNRLKEISKITGFRPISFDVTISGTPGRLLQMVCFFYYRGTKYIASVSAWMHLNEKV